MKKGVVFLFALVMVIAAVLYFSRQNFKADTAGGSKETIKIGVVVPLSKSFAFMGNGMKNGILLAKDALPSSDKYNYDVIFEDGQLDATASLNAAQKLINVDKVDAIISFNSEVGSVINPLAEKSKVIHMGIASNKKVADGEYNFIHWTQPSEESKVFVAELQKRGLKRLGILGIREGGGQAIADSVKADAAGTDVSIVSEEFFTSDEKDFRTIITKSEATKPDAYLLLVSTDVMDLIAKQTKELGVKTPLTSIESFDFTKNPDLYEGLWYVQAAEASNSFNDSYTKKYGEAPSVGAPNAYDEFNLIVSAFEKAGKTSKTKVTSEQAVKNLNGLKSFAGALGDLTIDDQGIVNSHAVVKVMVNGKGVVQGK